MSGKDERPIRDFPSCRICDRQREIPFWAAYEEDYTIYFDGVGYRDSVEPTVVTRIANDDTDATLEQINRATHLKCVWCGSFAVESLFAEIIEIGRRAVVGTR